MNKHLETESLESEEEYQNESAEKYQKVSEVSQKESQEQLQEDSHEHQEKSQESQENLETETLLEAPSQSILQLQTETELNLKLYSCLRCGKNRTENELEGHMEAAIHVFDPPKWYNCILSGENHLDEASLKTHINEVHCQNLVDTKSQPEI